MRSVFIVMSFSLLFILASCQHTTPGEQPRLLVQKSPGPELLLVNRVQDWRHCQHVVQRSMRDQVTGQPLPLQSLSWNTLRVVKLNSHGQRFAMAFSFIPEQGHEYRLLWSSKMLHSSRELSLELQSTLLGQQHWRTVSVKPRQFDYRLHRLAFRQRCQDGAEDGSSIASLMAHIASAKRLNQVRANSKTAQGMLVVNDQ